MKKSLVLPLFMTAATVDAGFYAEIGPSYRIDWQRVETHIDPSPSTGRVSEREQYKNLNIWELHGRIATDFKNPFYVGAEGKYGWVGSGSGNTQAAFDLTTLQMFNNLDTEVSGHTYDVEIFAGYRLYFARKRFAFIPVGGYEHHKKSFTQNKGFFNVNGLLTGFTQTDNYLYKDQLRGPFAGADFEWVWKGPFLLFGGFHWNWFLATSRATVSYNVNPTTSTLVGTYFKANQHANIQGPSGNFGMTYSINCHAYVCLKTSYYYTYLSNGHKINTVFTENFNLVPTEVLVSQAIHTTPLKIDQWQWSSWSIQLMVGYDF